MRKPQAAFCSFCQVKDGQKGGSDDDNNDDDDDAHSKYRKLCMYNGRSTRGAQSAIHVRQ